MKDLKGCRPKLPRRRVTVIDVTVLMLFHAARENCNVSNEPVHKEKLSVPVSGTQHFSYQKLRYIFY